MLFFTFPLYYNKKPLNAMDEPIPSITITHTVFQFIRIQLLWMEYLLTIIDNDSS